MLTLYIPIMVFSEVRIGSLQVRTGRVPDLLDDINSLQQAQLVLQGASDQNSLAECMPLQCIRRYLSASHRPMHNLILRLEACASTKTGAEIKGLEVAKASLLIAGSTDDVRVTTLPEVLALVKFRGVAFTSRHPRTLMKQFWRPSAWADAWYGYYPGKSLCRGDLRVLHIGPADIRAPRYATSASIDLRRMVTDY
ncbi:hypothetical protein WJX74_001318 [Apatococcus lobatus]|uniref:Uncharacterized protein n=1 Tax=Apatococcus lobatus TaxID=904363 RepID=A0AAW1QTX9_9CHLO